MAVLHAGLAGCAGDGRARLRALSAVVGAGHRLRHHLLLGGAHDHGHRQLHRPGAVPRCLHHRPDSRCAGPEDVQVQGQRARSAGHHRRHQHRRPGGQAHQRADEAEGCAQDRKSHTQGIPGRHHRPRCRRAALHHRRARHAWPRHQVRSGPRRGLQELLQQAVERHALRVDEQRRRTLYRRAAAAHRSGKVDPGAPGQGHRGNPRALRQLSLRPARAIAVRIRLECVLRLVRGAGQAGAQPSGRRRGRQHAPHAAVCAGVVAAPVAPAHPVRHRRIVAAGRTAPRHYHRHNLVAELPAARRCRYRQLCQR